MALRAMPPGRSTRLPILASNQWPAARCSSEVVGPPVFSEYVVSVMGITGERNDLAPQVAVTMRRARSAFKLPLALGFGLREPSQLEALSPDARPDAVVFGSALLKHIDAGNSAAEFLARWK